MATSISLGVAVTCAGVFLARAVMHFADILQVIGRSEPPTIEEIQAAIQGGFSPWILLVIAIGVFAAVAFFGSAVWLLVVLIAKNARR